MNSIQNKGATLDVLNLLSMTGIALAKQQGKYHGRKPQYAKDDPRLQHAFKGSVAKLKKLRRKN